MPWIDGGLPVIIDTLLGQVKLGITHSATALNPVCIKRAMFGTIPSLSARSISAGSAPSLQMTTTGRSGQRYRTPLRRISEVRADVICCPCRSRAAYATNMSERGARDNGDGPRPRGTRHLHSIECANRRARRLAALRDASA